MLRPLNVFLVLCQLIALAFAGVDLPSCPEGSVNLSLVPNCSVSPPVEVTSYCIYGSLLFVLDPNYYPGCYYGFEKTENIIAVNGYKINTISDLSKITVDPNNDIADYPLQHIAFVSCSYVTDYNNNTYFQCYQTNGIIRDQTNTFYNIYSSSSVNNAKADTYHSSCFSSTIGELATIDKNVSLCLGEKKYVTLSNINTGYYMMDGTDNKKSVFATPTKSNILIKAGKDYFMFDVSSIIVDNYLDYKKNLLSTTFYIGSFYESLYSCASGACTPSQTKIEENSFLYPSDTYGGNYFSGIIYDFKKNEKDKTVIISKSKSSGVLAFITSDATVYKKIKVNEFTNQGLVNENSLPYIYIFSCQYGECLPTSGFLKYKSSYDGSYQIAICDSNCNMPATYNGCNYAPAAYYDTKSSNFYVCVRTNSNYNPTIEQKKILNDDSYYFFDIIDKNIFNIYESDEGGNIVGYSKSIGSLYIDQTGDGVGDLISCTRLYPSAPSTCQILYNYSGYFINMAFEDSNHLISCQISKCEDIVLNNGYFTSDDGTIIKCSEGECRIQSTIDISCSNHSGEVILMNKNGFYVPQFCNGSKAMDLTDKLSYYVLNNIDAASTYPNIEKGNDTIIVESYLYSITQITTGSDGICIDNGANTSIADPACTNVGLTKYYCDTICTTCTLEKQPRAKYIHDNTISECATYLENNKLYGSSGALSMFANSKFNIMIVGIISLLILLL